MRKECVQKKKKKKKNKKLTADIDLFFMILNLVEVWETIGKLNFHKFVRSNAKFYLNQLKARWDY